MEIAMLKCPDVMRRVGQSRSALYAASKRGLFTPPIRWAPQSSGWPAHEVDMILRARIAGWNEEKIRELVKRLIAERALATSVETATA